MRSSIAAKHFTSNGRDVEKKGETECVRFSNIMETQTINIPPTIDTSSFSVIPGATKTIWRPQQRAHSTIQAITKTKYTDVCPASHDVLPDESHPIWKHHIQQEYDEQMVEKTHDIEREEEKKENVVIEEDQTVPELKAEYASISQVSISGWGMNFDGTFLTWFTSTALPESWTEGTSCHQDESGDGNQATRKGKLIQPFSLLSTSLMQPSPIASKSVSREETSTEIERRRGKREKLYTRSRHANIGA